MADELDGRLNEMEKSLASLESQVREQTLRTQSGTRTVLVVGIILIAVLFVWLGYLSMKIKEQMQPEMAAETLAAMVTNRLPALKDALIQHAPDVVANARQMAVSDIPVAREWAEKKSLAMVDLFADKLEAQTNDMVDKILAAHRAELQPLIEAAAQPGDAAKLQEAFRKSMEDLVGQDLDQVLDDFDRTMSGIEHRLDRYKMPDTQLTPDEQLEKEALISLMSLVDQAVQEPGMVTPPAKPAPAAQQPASSSL